MLHLPVVTSVVADAFQGFAGYSFNFKINFTDSMSMSSIIHKISLLELPWYYSKDLEWKAVLQTET